MSNINNTLTTTTTLNRNSALSMNELALKSWYSNLHISSAPSKNRISPIAPVPASSKAALQEPSSPSLSHLFRKIARTPTRTLSRSSTTMSHASWKKHQQNVHIYLKSPHVVASGELAGSIVVLGDTTLVHKIKSIRLDLVGLEAVHDSSKTNKKSYPFLNLSVLQLTGPEQVAPYHVSSAKATEQVNKIIVPFLASLPSDLSGTYVDKKGSIQYYLKSEIQWHADKPILHQQAVTIYSNMVLKSLKDATDLYTPVMLSNRQIWKTTKEGHVSIETSMPRSLWMSGAPIYVTVTIHNDMLSDTVSDIKLELLRKQNTYSIHHLDESLVPVTSSCETLVTSCLAELGWWKPLEPASQDQVTLTIDAPPNQVTVRHQKLIDVSFSLRLSVQSVLNANTVVSDIPVMLVHPISMDPPPGNYTKSVAASNTEECHLILQEAVTKIATQSSISVSSTPSLVSSYTESDGTKSLSEMNVPARKKFTSMKKSLSKWGLQLSRKMSISSGINSHCESDRQSNAEKTKLRISSPLISSSSSPSASSLHSSVYSKSSSSSLQPDQANEEITRIIKNKELQQAQQQEENPEKSIMKFGQIVGPKRFGQQPGCLGDAGLDIRNCFNVATATEAIQCYAAEKVEIPSYPDDKEEKELVMAPHTEKCQIDPDMMSKRQIQQYEQDHYGSSHQEEEEEEEEDGALTDQQHHGNSTKRMLASSRHLRNVQRKSVQVSRDGRALLTFSK
ncbi:hypothetical protein V8B55DRAFT_1456858 [Mucor lusitanicus]|uniref:Arrestin C-terminal-like domain-containing protein n=1 Tax=Mucor lusitanicus CBS 277.49 TaxID=747725 RepID=A0A162T5M9_MUCCL|nr:hypothetical protein MUCCIDRAFT_164031 [Mucor lusitanicus CBS 277.49]